MNSTSLTGVRIPQSQHTMQKPSTSVQHAAPAQHTAPAQHAAPVQRVPLVQRPATANQGSWSKFETQAAKAVLDPRDRNSFLYPVRQVGTDIRSIGGSELRKSVVATILFLVVSNPEVFKMLQSLLKDTVEIASESGAPNTQGIVIVALLFFVIYYLIATYLPNMGV